MQYSQYSITEHANHLYFEFFSEGPRGRIKKGVRYSLIYENEGLKVYNLAFGDVDQHTGGLNDLSLSNNNDRNKILATVAVTVLKFINSFPEAWVYARGSTPSRTRLYQISLALNFDEVSEYLDIYGSLNDKLYKFEKNVNYDYFIVLAK